jgi:hypothetical protein
VIGAALAALTACSSAQNFSDVEGGMRIAGQLDHRFIDLQHATLSLYLTDAGTGYPIDAKEIEVRSDGQTIAAKRDQLGSYSATVPDSDKIDVLVLARDEAARLSLKRQ